MNNYKYMPQIIGRNSGEDTLSHWPTASGLKTIDEASIHVLKYLDNVWGSLSSSGGRHSFSRFVHLCGYEWEDFYFEHVEKNV